MLYSMFCHCRSCRSGTAERSRRVIKAQREEQEGVARFLEGKGVKSSMMTIKPAAEVKCND
jgi:hypothetical protein